MMRSVVASHQKLTRTNWEQSLKLIFHNYMRICSRIQCWPSIVIQLLKQIEWVSESHSVMPNSLWPHGLYSLWNSPGQNTRVGSLSLLQGIFPTNGSNSGLLHYRWIPYQLSHKGSPRILEWVTYHFSNRSSWPRNWTEVSCITGRFFTTWTIRDALKQIGQVKKLNKWVPHELTTNFKKSSFWSVIFSKSMQQQLIISPLDHDLHWKVDFMQQPVMISSVLGPRRSSKVLPKAKLTPQKGHGHCLVVYSQCDPLQLSESQWKLYIWEVCSANWWDAPNTATLQLTLVNRKGPVLLHDNIQVHIAQPGPQKLNELSCEVLPHLPYSPDL